MLVKRKDIFVNFFGLMRYSLTVILLVLTAALRAQTPLSIEGQTYFNSDETWIGVNIPRSSPTLLTFRNNSITSSNINGYMLEAGDEVAGNTNYNLNGAIITGNKFTWTGTDMKSITHGLFTGHNINVIVKYNYLDRVPMGIIRKSTNNMVNTSGAVAYNIVKSPNTGIVVKGMSGVAIFNNTLYQERTTSETGRGLIDIYTNRDISPVSVSHNTKIYNNIFYTKHQTLCVNVMDQESLTGLECDYNIYYCESGSPKFNAGGAIKTFEEWQAMGFDQHSRVINPNFRDFIKFVPAARLDYGTDLGSTWNEGLSVNASWGTTSPETAYQNGKWQVGAVIYKEVINPEPVQPPANLSPLISISSPIKSTAFTAPATITIDAIVSDPDGSIARVEFYNGTIKLGERTSAPWSFTWKDVAEGNYNITAAATDNLNSKTVSAAVSVVVEKSAPAVNEAPSIAISVPLNNGLFEAPAIITMTAIATDSDGSVVKVEYLLGGVKIGESSMPPFSFAFGCDTAGVYHFTAIAYDNLNAKTTSLPVKISVNPGRVYPDQVNLYPAPNDGYFTVDINLPAEISGEISLSIINLTGRTVYQCALTPEETTRRIDMTDAFPGLYILRITDGMKVLTAKRFLKY